MQENQLVLARKRLANVSRHAGLARASIRAEEPGVGPICAGRLLAFHPSRFTSEAAFARANGTAPQPASSGRTVDHWPHSIRQNGILFRLSEFIQAAWISVAGSCRVPRVGGRNTYWGPLAHNS